MFRTFFKIAVLMFLIAPVAFAADAVSVRLGAHDGYSRMVFDFDKRVPYTVETSKKGRVKVMFEGDVKLGTVPSFTQSLANITGFQIEKPTPAAVSVQIPDDSRVRHFFAGRRLVIDVYNSPSGQKMKSETAPEPVSVAAVEPEVVPKPEEKPVVLEATKKEEKKPEEVASAKIVEVETPPSLELVLNDDLSIPVQPVQQAEIKEEKPKEPLLQKAEASSVVTLSATQGFGVAVFNLNRRMWIVSDQEDMILTPQLSGPQSENLKPVTEERTDMAKVFRLPTLPQYHVKSQGGGLIWRLILSKNDIQIPFENYKKPDHRDVDVSHARSGYIFWPFKEAREVIDLENPLTGQVMKVVSVGDTADFSGPAQHFVDFETLPAAAGLAILPKVDDLMVEIVPGGVKISRPSGLALSDSSIVEMASKNQLQEQLEVKSNWPRVYDFENWALGGLDVLEQNKNIILGEVKNLPEVKRGQDVLALAKMYLANAQTSEALGFLGLSADLAPGIEKNPAYIALRGATNVLHGEPAGAFRDLSIDGLELYPEAGYWRAYALAQLGDWNQAIQVMPDKFDVLFSYPDLVFNRLALGVAEVLLRAGNAQQAERVLDQFDHRMDNMLEPQIAALNYLKGEMRRQNAELKETQELWEELADGLDDRYRVRAGLALTRLRVNEGELGPQQAIDNLERLRYAWRGDGLEAQVNYWLGKTYFENDEYMKGLNIMREAATYTSETQLGKRIAAEMSKEFTGLFLGDKLDTVSPLDATAMYEQFSELVPTGKQGEQVVERLSERMVQADLLNRATNLLKHQIEHRVGVFDQYRLSKRLAAVHLLNNDPVKALEAVGKAEEILQTLGAEHQTKQAEDDLLLLRAHALSERGNPAQSLKILRDLERTPRVNQLMADIAWKAGYWDDAAEALEYVVQDKGISLTRPLVGADKMLLLRYAVALNLAGDRIALANVREKYTDLMAQTDRAKMFELITRPRQSSGLADRTTLMNVVSEVDLFKDFLDSYKSVN